MLKSRCRLKLKQGQAEMITRRDVLAGVGAGLGVAALSALAFARREGGLGPAYQFGAYDTLTYVYRGHQYTDADGRFELITVLPQAYTAISIFRTPHIHVKVQGADTPLLTTQLYLPDAEETNARDRGYQQSLAVRYTERDDSSRRASFDFGLSRG